MDQEELKKRTALYWLEILSESNIVKRESVKPLMGEANELVSSFVVTLKTANL